MNVKCIEMMNPKEHIRYQDVLKDSLTNGKQNFCNFLLF